MSGTFSNDVLNPLVRGTDLERAQARAALVEILEGQVEGVLIASFLTALTAKGETADEMTGFIDAMIDAARRFRSVRTRWTSWAPVVTNSTPSISRRWPR